MGGINQIRKEAVTSHFCLRWVHHVISLRDIRVIFKSSTRNSNFFQFKDKMPYCLRSNVVYKFSCGRYNATYYGETCRHLSVRVG